MTGQPGYIRDFGDATLIFSFSLNFLSCPDVLLQQCFHTTRLGYVVVKAATPKVAAKQLACRLKCGLIDP